MAYLRKEKHVVEIDYPLIKVWEGIPKVITTLDWKLEEIDNKTHQLKVNTQAGLLAYGSTLNIEVWIIDENTTRIRINAETPVTTITALADFGRIRDRIELFFEVLAKELNENKENSKKNKQFFVRT